MRKQMAARLRRYSNARVVALMVSVGIGVAWFVWHSGVNSCGYRGLKGEPNFSASTALAVLLPIAPLATVACGLAERRSPRVIARLALTAVALSAVASGIAEVGFIADRHCFE